MTKFINELDLYSRNKDYNSNLTEMNKAFGHKQNHVTFSAFWDDITARKAHSLYVPDFADALFQAKGDRYATMELSAASK